MYLFSEPLPSDPLGAKLCQIFGTYRWETIEGDTHDATSPNWRTVKNFPLRPRSLWLRWQDAAQLVGVRFGTTTAYALLDIDAGSDYLRRLDDIKAALETLGIVRTLLVRSSWSGGVHLYCPLPKAVNTFELACTLKHGLEAQGLTLAEGQLEAFPNVKSYGRWWLGEFTEYNAHRLPLQPGSGSVLLDEHLQPTGAGLERFFWAWQFAEQSQDMDLLAAALKHGRDCDRKRPKLKHHPIELWRLDLEAEISEGWTANGQTNSLLKSIACYGRVFERLAGDELAEYVERIAVTRPGFFQWCRHQHQISRKARTWARAAERYYWPLGEAPQRDKSALNLNQERAEDAQARIRAAVVQLAKTGQLAECVKQRAIQLCKQARCSAKTLYKYLSLWHPEQWCVTPHGEGDTAQLSAAEEASVRSLDTPSAKGLHTLENFMKGVPPEGGYSETFSPGERGGAGGERGFPQPAGGA
ncbi:MAG: hypothetical protein F6J97_00420 [Leptolyngbya sp. SIO4C1]|nr:hypothetical protein [Leptolyngbya sp. SIO4C1]